MHFRLKIVFLLLALVTVLFGAYSFAQNGSEDTVTILDVVKGTVLLKIKNEELLNNDLRQIFTGKDRLKKSKLIRVEGTNDGNEIKLEGIGANSQGYTVTLNTSSGNCGVSPILPGKAIKRTIPFPYPFSIGFDTLSTGVEPDVETNDKYKCVGANGMATLIATFNETEDGNSVVSGKFKLRFKSLAGSPGTPHSNECAGFPSPDSSNDNAIDEGKYIETPNIINVKLENIPSGRLPNNPGYKAQLTVKVEVTNPEFLGFEAYIDTTDYAISLFPAGFGPEPNIATIVIISNKTIPVEGVPIFEGLPSCITFSLVPIASMTGSFGVDVKEVLEGDKPVTGVMITQSDEVVQVTCKDPNDCD